MLDQITIACAIGAVFGVVLLLLEGIRRLANKGYQKMSDWIRKQ